MFPRLKCVVGVVALTVALPLLAQEQNIRSLTFYKVKSDRIGDFSAAVKEYNEVLKKAGATRAYNVYRRQSGEGEFVLVRTMSKWAEMDQQDPKLKDVRSELTAIGARINTCVSSSDRLFDQVVPDMSIRPAADAPLPKMIRSLRVRVRPDKVNEYMALVKSELLPAVKKSGLPGYVTYRNYLGSSRFEFRVAMAINSWADLDDTALIVKGFGGMDAYNKYLAKVSPLITVAEYSVSRYREDLSYNPKK